LFLTLALARTDKPLQYAYFRASYWAAHRISRPRQEPHWLGVRNVGAAADIKQGLIKNLANFTK
jgi:hypothetical protein